MNEQNNIEKDQEVDLDKQGKRYLTCILLSLGAAIISLAFIFIPDSQECKDFVVLVCKFVDLQLSVATAFIFVISLSLNFWVSSLRLRYKNFILALIFIVAVILPVFAVQFFSN